MSPDRLFLAFRIHVIVAGVVCFVWLDPPAAAQPSGASHPSGSSGETHSSPASQGAPSAPDADARSLTAVDRATADACLRSFGDAGSVRDITDAALDYALVSPRRVSAAMESARMKGLLPTVYVLGMYRNDEATQSDELRDMMYKSKYTSGDWPYKERTDTDAVGHRFYAGVALRFDFGTLALGSEALGALEASRFRTGLVEKVSSLYHARRRLQIEVCATKLPYSEELIKRSRIDEISAVLEGMTGQNRDRTRPTRVGGAATTAQSKAALSPDSRLTETRTPR